MGVLAGKVAEVAGGSRGTSRAAVERLGRWGCRGVLQFLSNDTAAKGLESVGEAEVSRGGLPGEERRAAAAGVLPR